MPPAPPVVHEGDNYPEEHHGHENDRQWVEERVRRARKLIDVLGELVEVLIRS